MIPSVFFRGKYYAIISGEIERTVFGQFGQRIIQRDAALPDFFCAITPNVVNPVRPGLRQLRDHWLLHLFANQSDKRELTAVRRPARIQVAIGAGREVAQRVAAEFVNNDKAVIAAIADKSNSLPIRRPLRLRALATDKSQRLSFFLARDWRDRDWSDPNLLLRRP